MKKILFTILLFAVGFTSKAQVGIGTTTPNSSSILDLTATNKALLITRVVNSSAVASPVNGMMVYDISINAFRFFQNNIWVTLGSPTITDAISAALTTSKTAYTAATTNTYVLITEAEYLNLSTTVATVKAGNIASVPLAAGNASNSFAGNIRTLSSGTAQAKVPANSYIVAFAVRQPSAYGPFTPTYKLKGNYSASQASGYFDYANGMTPTTTGPNSATLYYVIKKPSNATFAGGASYFSIHSGTQSFVDNVETGGTTYYTASDTNALSTQSSLAPNVQLLTTPTLQW